VLSGLDLAFPAERTGIVGRNGTGKSTLLRLIAGELVPSGGTVHRNGTIAALRQIVARRPNETLAEALDLAEPLNLLRRAEQGLASAEDLENADWTLESRLAAALTASGLDVDATTPVDALSGGQQTRAGLAAAILADPDFLLLDEPTNNLDAEGRASLMDFLAGWRKGALIVSHDRALLEGMDAIVELTSLGATRYGGPYSHYLDRKALDLAAARQALDSAERAVDQARSSAQTARERKDRRDGVGQRKAARGDMPRILIGARRERAENTSGGNARMAERESLDAQADLTDARARLEVIEPLKVTVAPTGLSASRKVLDIDGVTAGYTPGHHVLSGINLTLTGPERVALVGPNGSGKSTLFSLIRGTLAPSTGTIRVHVPFALLDQHATLLDPQLSITENLRRLKPELDENAARAALARFRFRAASADQTVGSLSGGQAMRAALACTLSGTPPPLLLLDEPTNHLDLETIEAIEAGLAAYDGAMLVISHDTAFLNALGLSRNVSLGG
ncbi:MAG: hypothetical protein RIS85_288, partial [Pseudomonadota bacterium]